MSEILMEWERFRWILPPMGSFLADSMSDSLILRPFRVKKLYIVFFLVFFLVGSVGHSNNGGIQPCFSP